MRTEMRLCFIDLDDWFKIYFIPISAIIFVRRRRSFVSSKMFHFRLDYDYGDDFLC